MKFGWNAAARKLGITVEEYTAHREAGERWCTAHQDWHPEDHFPINSYKPQRLSHMCRDGHVLVKRERRIRAAGGDFPRGIVVAAARLGILPAEYAAHVAKGERWCTPCREWHDKEVFVKGSSGNPEASGECRDALRRRNSGKPWRRPSLPIHTKGLLQDSVDRMCRSCEPDGECHMSDCPLRPVSPLPLATRSLRRLSA